MPAGLTEITEIVTALGTVARTLEEAFDDQPVQLLNVGEDVWGRVRAAYFDGLHPASFTTAFANGRAFLIASDGLRHREPLRIEWKGPHKPPGDDVIPADLRIDHVFLVSCKYLSRVLLNPGPPRLFERLLVGDERSTVNWFATTAPDEFRSLYEAAKHHTGLSTLPASPLDLRGDARRTLKVALNARTWPEPLQEGWRDLCRAVSQESARRWRLAMTSGQQKLRLFWRMLRITTASYFVLGTDHRAHLRIRVDSAWDWLQAYELRAFEVSAREAGQPEVRWQALIRRRIDGIDIMVEGHVEIRWSHGRFVGAPESKIYLDTPHDLVPGYNLLS